MSCSTEKKVDKCQDMEMFKQRIIRIDAYYFFEYTYVCFHHEFHETLINPNKYFICAKECLINGNLTNKQKEILILSMNRIEVGLYIELLEILESKIEKGQCHKKVLLEIIQNGNMIIDNLDYPKMFSFYNRIKEKFFPIESKKDNWPWLDLEYFKPKYTVRGKEYLLKKDMKDFDRTSVLELDTTGFELNW